MQAFITFLSFIFIGFSLVNTNAFSKNIVVNDVTQMTPIIVEAVAQPDSTEEIIRLVKLNTGPISIAGGKYSMGGQTATNNALQIDLTKLNQVVSFYPEQKEITVQTGMTWRQIQEIIDPHNLSIMIMQSYANFTVGGSLSVNVHGRYVGEGPIILSVKQIKIVLADGSLMTASLTHNKALFYGAIGGYGGLGIITEATLQLKDNVKIEQISQLMPIGRYKNYFVQHLRNSKKAIFHNAIIYPPEYQTVRSVTFYETNKPLTVTERLVAVNRNYSQQQKQMNILADSPIGKQLRKAYDFFIYQQPLVKWRNNEASLDLLELGKIATKEHSFALQEYFIPVEQFDQFYPQLVNILKRKDINIINISIRHSKPDPGSLMAWAKTEVFAFVIYYRQGRSAQDKLNVQQWTRELIDLSIALNGSYYLPYQLHATQEQFNQAYPNRKIFLALKQQVDPTQKFRNKLWDMYLDELPIDSVVKEYSH